MKNKKLYLLIFLLFSVCKNTIAQNLPAPFKIIPQPQKVVLAKSSGILISNLHQIILLGEFERPILGKNLSRLIIGKNAGKGTISLKLDQNNIQITNNEGYIL
jgi:hypothetical protein